MKLAGFTMSSWFYVLCIAAAWTHESPHMQFSEVAQLAISENDHLAPAVEPGASFGKQLSRDSWRLQLTQDEGEKSTAKNFIRQVVKQAKKGAKKVKSALSAKPAKKTAKKMKKKAQKVAKTVNKKAKPFFKATKKLVGKAKKESKKGAKKAKKVLSAKNAKKVAKM